MGFDPVKALSKISEIESTLREGPIDARSAKRALSSRISELFDWKATFNNIPDPSIRDEVQRCIDRAIEDVFALADEYGIGLGGHTRRLRSGPTEPSQQR